MAWAVDMLVQVPKYIFGHLDITTQPPGHPSNVPDVQQLLTFQGCFLPLLGNRNNRRVKNKSREHPFERYM